MHAVCVYVHVKPENRGVHCGHFENARLTLVELGNLRFDVIQQADDLNRFVLLEVSRDAADAGPQGDRPLRPMRRGCALMAERVAGRTRPCSGDGRGLAQRRLSHALRGTSPGHDESRSAMKPETVGRAMEVLLVEDDLEDAGLAFEALRRGEVPCRISLVRDGEEALEFLRRVGRFARVPRPDIILLDIQLPKLDGREVLAQVKADESLKTIPVVMTVSRTHEDILKSENLHAESHLTKPPDLQQFLAVVKSPPAT